MVSYNYFVTPRRLIILYHGEPFFLANRNLSEYHPGRFHAIDYIWPLPTSLRKGRNNISFSSFLCGSAALREIHFKNIKS